jgi:IS30 family transposase
MDRISDTERQRIAELLAEGAPVWRLHKEINRSRYAIRRAVVALHRPPKREPRRSPLRLSLAEREDISRGLAAGEPVREIARRLGRAPSTVCREVAANGGRGRYRACAADRRAVRRMRGLLVPDAAWVRRWARSGAGGLCGPGRGSPLRRR